ncbi:MAG: sulfite oxidase [Gammaproteobacteria bacterium]|nr:sulfite oxidase [Gammaproteobacteria bacterium]
MKTAWAKASVFEFPLGKSGLRLLNDRPLNAESVPHLLDDDVTRTAHLFIRNNGLPPVDADIAKWTLSVDGESVVSPLTLSVSELKSRFENVSLQLTLECGGNGRAEFEPSVPGNQWTLGAIGCPQWQGVRLRDVLKEAGIKDDAVYLGFHSADRHLSGDGSKEVISRGIPIEKAMADDAMIAWGMNGLDLPPIHGYPLRLVVAGWPGSVSGKWLTRISLRNRVHDGAKMLGKSYRVPRFPVAPGTTVADDDMMIIAAMPIKSLITAPQTDRQQAIGELLTVRGHAWVGDDEVKTVEVSIDFGETWQVTKLSSAVNPGAWQHFQTTIQFPSKGYFEVWAKASDSVGRSQPMVMPAWNPKGYLNNACHRVSVHVV